MEEPATYVSTLHICALTQQYAQPTDPCTHNATSTWPSDTFTNCTPAGITHCNHTLTTVAHTHVSQH